MRARVLRGRVRTSTMLLALVFLLTLATYLLVRPVPASVAAISIAVVGVDPGGGPEAFEAAHRP
jgi:hypothetical protein